MMFSIVYYIVSFYMFVFGFLKSNGDFLEKLYNSGSKNFFDPADEDLS